MHDFPHPKDRVRRILESAFINCTYVSSQSDQDGSMLLLKARRSDGTHVSVRFRGVRESDATAEPVEGSQLRLEAVSDCRGFSLRRLLEPILWPRPLPCARVRLAAGGVVLDILCQDVEWWEDDGPSGKP